MMRTPKLKVGHSNRPQFEALLFKNSWMLLRVKDEMLRSFQYGNSQALRTVVSICGWFSLRCVGGTILDIRSPQR
jgi:hypothetical protein